MSARFRCSFINFALCVATICKSTIGSGAANSPEVIVSYNQAPRVPTSLVPWENNTENNDSNDLHSAIMSPNPSEGFCAPMFGSVCFRYVSSPNVATVYLTKEKAKEPFDPESTRLSIAELGSPAFKFAIHVKEDATAHDLTSTIRSSAKKIFQFYNAKSVVLEGDLWTNDPELVYEFWITYGTVKKRGTMDVSKVLTEKSALKAFEDRKAVTTWLVQAINCPSQDMGPERFADVVKTVIFSAVADAGLSESTVKLEETVGEEALQRNLFVGTWTIGRSGRTPRFLKLDFNPSGKDDTPVTVSIVGKGILFDAGGLDIKTHEGMRVMHTDMGGGALAAASLAFAIRKGFKERAILRIPMAENLLNSVSHKPADIITYLNKYAPEKSINVEIGHTDAEGRVVMADALFDGWNDNPKVLLTMATLTGAAKQALGRDYHAILSLDDELTEQFLQTSKASTERFWRLPLEKFHSERVTAAFGDITNDGKVPGASTAAGFLSKFVARPEKGWLHFDLSATYIPDGSAGDRLEGATAIGVQSLAKFIVEQQQSS